MCNSIIESLASRIKSSSPRDVFAIEKSRTQGSLGEQATQDVIYYEAAGIAERIREALLRQGTSFCFETVYSHPSKIDFIATAKGLGYEVINCLTYLVTNPYYTRGWCVQQICIVHPLKS